MSPAAAIGQFVGGILITFTPNDRSSSDTDYGPLAAIQYLNCGKRRVTERITDRCPACWTFAARKPASVAEALRNADSVVICNPPII